LAYRGSTGSKEKVIMASVDKIIRAMIGRYLYESDRTERTPERRLVLNGMSAMLTYAVSQAYGWDEDTAAEWIGDQLTDTTETGR
jgi:hypothetical protein